MALRDMFRRRREVPAPVDGADHAGASATPVVDTAPNSDEPPVWTVLGRLSRTPAHPMTGEWSSFAASLAVRNQPLVLRPPMHDVGGGLVGTFTAPSVSRGVAIGASAPLDLAVRRHPEAPADPAGGPPVFTPPIRRSATAAPVPALAPIRIPPLAPAGPLDVPIVDHSAGPAAASSPVVTAGTRPTVVASPDLDVSAVAEPGLDPPRPLRPRIVEMSARPEVASRVARQPAEPGAVSGAVSGLNEVEAFGVRMARSTDATMPPDAAQPPASSVAVDPIGDPDTIGASRVRPAEHPGIARSHAVDHRLVAASLRPDRVLSVRADRVARVSSEEPSTPGQQHPSTLGSGGTTVAGRDARPVLPHRPLVVSPGAPTPLRPSGGVAGGALHRFASVGGLADQFAGRGADGRPRLPSGSPATQLPRRVPTVADLPFSLTSPESPAGASWQEVASHLPVDDLAVPSTFGTGSFPGASLLTGVPAPSGMRSVPGTGAVPALPSVASVRSVPEVAAALADRTARAFSQLPSPDGLVQSVGAPAAAALGALPDTTFGSIPGAVLGDVSAVAAGAATAAAGSVASTTRAPAGALPAAPALPGVPGLPSSASVPDLQALTDSVAERVERRLRAELLRERERKGSLSGGGRR